MNFRCARKPRRTGAKVSNQPVESELVGGGEPEAAAIQGDTVGRTAGLGITVSVCSLAVVFVGIVISEVLVKEVIDRASEAHILRQLVRAAQVEQFIAVQLVANLFIQCVTLLIAGISSRLWSTLWE